MGVLIQNILMNLIQVHYPGGYAQFTEDGGLVGIANGTPNELIVRHPDIPIDIKNRFDQAAQALGLQPRFVTLLNFDDRNLEEIVELFSKNLDYILRGTSKETVLFGLNYLYVDIVILDKKVSMKQAEGIVNRMKEVIPDCLRFYVIYNGNKFLHMEFSPGETRAMIEAPERQTVISDDDMLNLKIALGNAQTVDDFIRNL